MTIEDLEEVGTRLMCDVLSDMRQANKSRNYSYLKGLIEEAQYRANRMEDRIYSRNEVERLEKELIKLKSEIKKLRAEKEELE